MSGGPTSRFFGGLLVAVGVLIAGLSGLCSLAVVGGSMGSVLKGPQPLANLTLGLVWVALVGGLPFLVGVGLIVGGRALMKPAAERSPVPPPSYGQDPPDAPPRADL